ncbi:MAG: class I tRNA ligase family protein [Rickettsiales bacterium]|nr:class I tRNA ligase family protein [Rickettsiales bacterium]
MNFHILKDDAEICEGFDYWILGKLYQTIENSKKEFLKFEYAKAREIIEEFFWHYFCDNYLEICKVRSYGLNAEKIANKNLNQEEERLIIKKQQSAIKTLQICLNAILKLFAPFIPHICEEIYSVVFEEEFINKKSIHSRGNIALIDKNIAIETDFIELGDRALEIIFEVRKWKSERNLSMKTNINNLTIFNNQEICQIEEDLANVCNALIIDYKNDENNNLIEIKN